MNRFPLFAVSASLCLGCVSSGPRRAADDPLARIEALEWKRSLGDGALEAQARGDANPAVRARALTALGRLQFPQTAATVAAALTDPAAPVRSAAAFAAGLLGLSWQALPDDRKAALDASLLAAEAGETNPAVQTALLEALGRLATPADVERLVERLGTEARAAPAATALGVAQRQKAKLTDAAYAPLVAQAKSADPAQRFAAVYALALSKDPRAHDALTAALGDAFADVEALAAKGLGDLGQPTDAPALAPAVASGSPWAAVEAARALAKLAKGCTDARCPALVALASLEGRVDRVLAGDVGGGAPVVLAVAQQGLPPAGSELLARLRGRLAAKKPGPGRVLFAAGNLDCRLAAASDRLAGTVQASPGCGFGAVEPAWALATALKEIAATEAKGPTPARVQEGQKYLAHPDARVRLAALELLGSSNAVEAQPLVRARLADADPIVAASAAQAAAALKDTGATAQILELAARSAGKVDVAPALADALATLDAKAAQKDLEPWLLSPEAAIRHSAAAALTTLEGAPVRAAERERAPEQLPTPLPRDVKVRLRTTAGNVELTLAGADAPLTVGNFVALARRGYFDQIRFHRVVPGFVAQGGDPRGDGEGGPGYTIPCEATARPYRRGAVGMALGGKDTGGSQFFLTLTRQPHLEGKYTEFGEVTGGLEVADSLLEGDRILGVDLLD